MPRKAQPTEQLSKETQHLYDALNEGSPLACVLVAVAALEQGLMSLLQNYFIAGSTAKGMFEAGGVLGDFSSCSRLAYCLGLIRDKAYGNLSLLGRIRNEFAHSHVPIDFNNPHIKDLCKELVLPNHVAKSDFFPHANKEAPRFRFQMTVVYIWNWTLLTALQTKHRDKCQTPW